VVAAGPPGGRPPRHHGRNLDPILWIGRTGAPGCGLPPELDNRKSVHRQIRSSPGSGVWDLLLQEPADSGGEGDLAPAHLASRRMLRQQAEGQPPRGDALRPHRRRLPCFVLPACIWLWIRFVHAT
jgi:hypothetical protein